MRREQRCEEVRNGFAEYLEARYFDGPRHCRSRRVHREESNADAGDAPDENTRGNHCGTSENMAENAAHV